MRKKISCNKCWESTKDLRFIRIKSEIGDYVFCHRCAESGYRMLSQIEKPTQSEKKLMNQLRKFIAN